MAVSNPACDPGSGGFPVYFEEFSSCNLSSCNDSSLPESWTLFGDGGQQSLSLSSGPPSSCPLLFDTSRPPRHISECLRGLLRSRWRRCASSDRSCGQTPESRWKPAWRTASCSPGVCYTPRNEGPDFSVIWGTRSGHPPGRKASWAPRSTGWFYPLWRSPARRILW